MRIMTEEQKQSTADRTKHFENQEIGGREYLET